MVGENFEMIFSAVFNFKKINNRRDGPRDAKKIIIISYAVCIFFEVVSFSDDSNVSSQKSEYGQVQK